MDFKNPFKKKEKSAPAVSQESEQTQPTSLARKTKKPQRVGFLSSITSRLYIIFAFVLVLLAILIGRLAYMQVSNRQFYLDKLNKQTTYTVTQSSERGQIYDATGQALVDNNKKTVVTFTRSNKISAQEIKSIAKKLSTMVNLTETKVTERQKKDYYLADKDHYQAIYDQLPNNKKFDNYGNKLTEKTVYKNAVDAVPKSKIDYSEDVLKQVYTFTQMNAASNFSTVYLTTGDLTEDQIAYITANKSKLHGIGIGTDWDQTVTTSSESLADIIGTLSSEKTGLPQESAAEYLAKGYSLNDRVGTSYLQKQYEDDLQGTRTTTKISVDNEGNVIKNKQTSTGAKGNNLKLTLDLGFQNGVEGILNQYYGSEVASGNAAYSEGVYAVALNADTGAVLAMAGLSHDKDTGALNSDALGTVTDVFVPGSVVKGGTITAGWEAGVISGNQVLTDQTISVNGSNPINSWFTGQGSRSISAVQALEYSSNTYMVQIALKMMGQDYYPGMTLGTDGVDSTMTNLRNTYAEYGMGTKTGIDLPNESEGYKTDDYKPGNVLTEAFGQFDSYTPIQLAQYAATVANGGNRIAPHLVQGIYNNNADGGLGDLVRSVDTNVLNKVNISDEQMGIIQDGFYSVVNSSDPYATGTGMRSSAISISGKTGTAETFATNASGASVTTVNLNVVAYAKANDGTNVAVAVMYPHALNSETKAHQYIARDILNLYQSMYGGGH